jgi:predicted nucleic acid-binding protein
LTLRVFVDACVLFSAAYRTDSPLRKIWQHKGTIPVTSAYAAEEARRNLARLRPENLAELDELLGLMEVEGFVEMKTFLDDFGDLPEKDRPILAAAVEARAAFLITSDKKHFGPFYGKEIEGVEVVSPAMYFERIESEE